jgi:hypothetical protein
MKTNLDAVAAVLSRNWYRYDHGVMGTGAKFCTGTVPTVGHTYCTGNSYHPTHSPGCDVAQAAAELNALGYSVDISF